MIDYIAAAQSLIVQLHAPPQYHSVWVRNVDPDTGEHASVICVSIRPGQKIKVPTEHMGIPVVQVPWPKGA